MIGLEVVEQPTVFLSVGQKFVVGVEENFRFHSLDLEAHLIADAVGTLDFSREFLPKFRLEQATFLGERLAGRSGYFCETNVRCIPHHYVAGGDDLKG